MELMSTWVIISWVAVVVLTIINVVVFLQLKKASEQMLKMAFPGAKNMQEALQQMQGMMGTMRGMKGGRRGQRAARRGGGSNLNQAQLKQAMDTLQKMQTGKKR